MTDPNAVDDTQLQASQDAIDEAREAAKKVAEAEDIEVGDLPAFADSTPGVDDANAFSEGQGDQVADDSVEDADRETEVDGEDGPEDPGVTDSEASGDSEMSGDSEVSSTGDEAGDAEGELLPEDETSSETT